MMKDRRNKTLLFCAILILVLVMIISGLQILKSADFLHGQGAEGAQQSKTIEKDGKRYYPRQDVTVMMVLGIDQEGPVQASNSYINPGAADMVMLLVFDETNEACSVLYLNRDTMLDVSLLGLRGDYAGTRKEQLALAHTYGSGLEDSCENVRSTLENFLQGVTIDYYISMNMDAIPILNDAVGGVLVNVTDDFSEVDPSISMGKTVLRGRQVLSYVQTRKGVGDQKNVSRMERQKEYITSFLQQYHNMDEHSPEFLLSTYERIEPYIVTDCSTNTLTGMLSRYKDYALKEIVTVEGENVIGEEYYEFYVDEEHLQQVVLDLFYAEKK